MFKNTKAFSGFSVDNIDAAQHFYADVLGLETSRNEMGILELHIPGNNTIIIYPKQNHQPATFTILNFPVQNIKEAVIKLKSLGVTFQSYQEENFKTDDDNIFRGGGPLIAWFKDPAGNILSVLETE